MKLEGTLDVFSLRELIEITVYSSVTGVINIFSNPGSGQIFFRDGQPYHACYGDLVGERAVVALFEQQRASFTFVADLTSDGETLWHDPIDLVESCERQALRWSKLRSELAGPWLVPRLVGSPEAARARTASDHWMILASIDGRSRLEDIADLLGTELIEVCEAVVQMQRDGLVTLHQPDAALQARAEAGKTAGRKGLFGRVLSNLPAVAPTPPADPQQPAAPPSVAPEVERILRLLRSS